MQTKFKNIVIVSNGVIKDYRLICKRLKQDYKFDRNGNTLVIAADGGAKNCFNMKFMPDIVIGDMDSITIKAIESITSVKKPIKFINSVPEKDESDTQLAVDYAVGLGTKKILIVGAVGDRVDHTLANIFLLASPSAENSDIRILTEDSEIFVTKKSCQITGAAGKTVSLFSLSPCTNFIRTSGLKYRLKNEKLLFSPVRGLSNAFIGSKARIEISEGILLIIKEL
ncbi:MAG: thiamine diphosphokinase [Actinobacteria bacterium]|nr:thiamine diphosphokinase [Actinomycetota bacterium]